MNQLYRSWQISTAQDMGIEAARNGDTRNPFRDLMLASQWDFSRRSECVRMAASRGKLADAEEEFDAADGQPVGWIERVMGFVLGRAT